MKVILFNKKQMPFKSQEQRAACYARWNRGDHSWNCKEYGSKHAEAYDPPVDILKQKSYFGIKNRFSPKTLAFVLMLISVAAFITAVSTAVHSSTNNTVTFQSGTFFKWFTIIFVPCTTLAMVLWELPFFFGNLAQILVAAWVAVYFADVHNNEPGLNGPKYRDMYVITMLWTLISSLDMSYIGGWVRIPYELSLFILVVSGGMGLR